MYKITKILAVPSLLVFSVLLLGITTTPSLAKAPGAWIIEVDEETTLETQWIAEEGANTLSARLVAIQPEDQNGNNDERSFDVDVGPAPDEPDFSPAI